MVRFVASVRTLGNHYTEVGSRQQSKYLQLGGVGRLADGVGREKLPGNLERKGGKSEKYVGEKVVENYSRKLARRRKLFISLLKCCWL